MSVLSALDYTSVIVFAISGALAASRAQLDIVGFSFVACLTAVGGGTIRDVLLNRDAVFWIADPTYILIATLIATVVFFTAHLFESRLKALMWADAIALGVAVAAGAGVALKLGQPPVIIALMGVATGCFGGLMRDVVCNEVPLILTQGELYASAALAGAIAMITASYLDFTPIYSYISCAVLTFGLRAGSLMFGWSLPVYKSRPPRA
ncbi:trimeric intracellular cation channel family protein [Celeribacter baekdonensis]|uniref:Trimeric intracellular cation channel family protein n=1 Tax=Celeribacter baekdonensis TaxID=875171 RepID=A0A2R4M587_9RHOB|nr:trimeric intracellular cation channel family protein [Celeribacter baekdonensis]AVW92269.1 trimeric intracellular cation channel family protein [Celeribacter baekdonensis]|tara:strand:- start:127205 stop:127828 length:624 start_codon:yes stop_codon:yes gene_type:complete